MFFLVIHFYVGHTSLPFVAMHLSHIAWKFPSALQLSFGFGSLPFAVTPFPAFLRLMQFLGQKQAMQVYRLNYGFGWCLRVLNGDGCVESKIWVQFGQNKHFDFD
jgi:hypothetical protein